MLHLVIYFIVFFFFNDTATTEIYTLSLHDALPICDEVEVLTHEQYTRFVERVQDIVTRHGKQLVGWEEISKARLRPTTLVRSEEHTSELQSRQYLVCRLLLEKKKKTTTKLTHSRIL